MAAYFIFNHKVLDSDKLNNDYLPKALETMVSFSPEVLVVDQNAEIIEGNTEENRMVILKFKNRDEAKAWYNSTEYQNIIKLRLDSVDGRAMLCDEFIN